MNLLLDSHILLWYADQNARMSESGVASIQTARNLYFSAASIWELSLKMHTGKLPVRDVQALAIRLGCFLVPVTPNHASAIISLPRIHGDPFDHMLLAQAKVEGLTLMTHDKILGDYGVPVLLV